MLAIRVDPTDPTPPYEQLRRQLADAITVDALPAGTRLPTVRQLAGDLGLANGTVMRAYVELESAGLISMARARGTTVSARPSTEEPNPRQVLTDAAQEYLAKARRVGASDDATLRALTEAMRGARTS